MPFLLFLFLFAAFLFVIVVFSGTPDIGYVFNFTRHEWYRELRRDYHTSVQQFWREWRLLQRFARSNSAWIWATISGIVGLIITAILLIINLPHELKASVRNVYAEHIETDGPTFVTRQGSLDTRTRVITDGEPLAEDESVLVYIPRGIYTQPQAIVRDPEPELRFDPVREPPRTDDLVLTMDRVGQPKDDNRIIEAVSIAEVADVAEELRRLRRDSWVPLDPQRALAKPRPILYQERHQDVILSAHERRQFELRDDEIRLRPRAVARGVITKDGEVVAEVNPGLHVTKLAPHHAIAGSEIKYLLQVSNPHEETVPAVIVEEFIPDGWSVVDANPRGVLVNNNTLRWDIEQLARGEKHEFEIRVLVEGDVSARTRTVVTTGAAVDSMVAVAKETIIPDIAPEPAPKPEIPANGWASAGSKIEEPERDLTKPPSLPPSIKRIPDPKVRVLVAHPKRARLGPVQVKFTIRNEGEIAVEASRILVWLDNELTHARGRQINKAVGPLKPGDVKTFTLNLSATAAGETSSKIELRTARTVLDRGFVVMAIGNDGNGLVRPPRLDNQPTPGTSTSDPLDSTIERAPAPPQFDDPDDPPAVAPASFWRSSGSGTQKRFSQRENVRELPTGKWKRAEDR